MRSARKVAAFTAFLLALIAETAVAADERFRVCSITINSDNEIATFRKHLPDSDFEFVELAKPVDGSSPEEPSWLASACESGVRCDVLVVSGHFSDTYAGSFGTTFAGKPGLSLPLDALESRSCERSCGGVLGSPLEVFLLGCRTLAKGYPSEPLPKRDRELLAEHGVVRSDADQILEEIRYRGDVSNERRMRFAFAGVPHVYGFTWTAPTGGPIAPRLGKYFRRVGDYAAHLRKIARQRAIGERGRPNAALARSLQAGTFAEDRGFRPSDAEFRHDAASCFIRSERNTAASRLERIEMLLDGPGFFVHLPAIAQFLGTVDRSSFGPAEAAVLDRIRRHDEKRQATLELANEVENPLLRLELAQVARAVDWLNTDDAFRLQRAAVQRLLEPPTYGEERDVICAMDAATRERFDFRAGELSPKLYDDEFGIAALACVKPRDPEILARLGEKRNDSREWIARAAKAALEELGDSG